MTKKGAKELVLNLARYYPKQFPASLDREEIEERAQGYYEVLTEYDNKVIMEAAQNLLKTMNFLPTIAELREAADALITKNNLLAPVDEFTDEEGYRYKRINGEMVCVYRPHNAYVPADPKMREFMEEKRRIYAEVGAPLTYTMRQVRELAKKKGIKIEVVDDKVMLSRIFGGIEKQEEIKT